MRKPLIRMFFQPVFGRFIKTNIPPELLALNPFIPIDLLDGLSILQQLHIL